MEREWSNKNKLKPICIFCDKPLSSNYENVIVREAVKPKGYPHRWKEIGLAHEECAEKNRDKIEYDKYKTGGERDE